MDRLSVFKLRLKRFAVSVTAIPLLAMPGLTDSVPGTRAPTMHNFNTASPSNTKPDATYPLSPFTLINGFERPGQPWLSGHRGIDLAAHIGQEVRAPHLGTIHFSGVIAGRSVVSLRLRNGDLISLEPVATSHLVGDEVQAGSAIGTVTDEPGHCAERICVHLGLRRNSEYLDPLLLFAEHRPPIVLLPIMSAQ